MKSLVLTAEQILSCTRCWSPLAQHNVHSCYIFIALGKITLDLKSWYRVLSLKKCVSSKKMEKKTVMKWWQWWYAGKGGLAGYVWESPNVGVSWQQAGVAANRGWPPKSRYVDCWAGGAAGWEMVQACSNMGNQPASPQTYHYHTCTKIYQIFWQLCHQKSVGSTNHQS